MGKSAQVPLHIWLPDAMEAPTTISALIHAATMVNAGVYLLARTYPAFASVTWWPDALLWIGSISALVAAVSAYAESDLKRVLAYSTISQLGYMVAAVGAGAILASQFHLLSQAIFIALLALTPRVTEAAESLDVDLARDGTILLLSAAAAGGLGLFADGLTPDSCRFCAPNGFDASARLSLRWEEPGRASRAFFCARNWPRMPGAADGVTWP